MRGWVDLVKGLCHGFTDWNGRFASREGFMSARCGGGQRISLRFTLQGFLVKEKPPKFAIFWRFRGFYRNGERMLLAWRRARRDAPMTLFEKFLYLRDPRNCVLVFHVEQRPNNKVIQKPALMLANLRDT